MSGKYLAVWALVLVALVGCGQVDNGSAASVAVTMEVTPQPQPVAEMAELSPCANPVGEQVAVCETEAAAILAMTVRITIRQWTTDAAGHRDVYVEGGTGHGTVKDGRYIVTHNHFSIPLLSLQNDAAGQKVEISVFKAATGEPVLQDLPLTAVRVQPNGPESLIFDFQQYGDVGLLEMMGLPSAQFAENAQRTAQVGAEVAQIDWDGSRAYVVWSQIESVAHVDGFPVMYLSNDVMKGASGGGVFLNGVHIGNNWTHTMLRNKLTGDVLDDYSTAAINSTTTVAASG